MHRLTLVLAMFALFRVQTAFVARLDCESKCPQYIRKPDPVCGADGNQYYDRCHAECAGVQVVPCQTTSPVCACTKIYSPVCSDGKQYDNKCVAECAGAQNIVERPCPAINPACICIAIFKPVCCEGIEYSNECTAQCANAQKCIDGSCRTKPECICPLYYNPVCGDGKEYDNLCLAKCAGAKRVQDGRCDCACQKDKKEVCGDDRVTYDNACLAKCSGVTAFTPGPCCPPCAVRCSNTYYDPVCADGVTYTNSCQTACLCPRPKSIVSGKCKKSC